MAGVLHKHVHETEVKCPADKLYNLFRYNITDLPKVMPQMYKSVEVLEGDGVSLGTSRLFQYVLGDDPTVLTLRDRLVAVNDETKTLTLQALEGEVMEHYESFACILTVSPKDEGSLVTWSFEHEKKHEASPAPHAYIGVAGLMTGHCAGHLHKA